MRKNFLILSSVALVSILLLVRVFVVHKNRLEHEAAWFAEALQYEFSAKVDSIRPYQSQGGRIWAHVVAGDPKTYREDSLKQHFKAHAMLYFIFKHSGDSVSILFPDVTRLQRGDSISVSSSQDQLIVFRNGVEQSRRPLSESFMGFGSSPFKRDE